ncbi:MAG TPA: glucan biosynthesis protein G [Roseiarcus sp.]|nr:glucan biosynthesis protein G [Roseiarcus sp.]
MSHINRRALLVAVLAAPSAGWISRAFAQQSPPAPPAGPPTPPRFDYDDIVKRARELAAAPFDAQIPPLPDGLAHLDFDAWRDIRFKPDKGLLSQGGGPFRLELFHLGHLYQRPVTVNVIRDGIPAPVPYAANLFDYGRNKIDKSLPINLGFAGFRLHYPLNSPLVMDEVIAFLGASYFRFLGRGQRYGLSARGLGINSGVGQNEEFPFFREFWIETPEPGAQRAIVHGLLDGAAATGALRFEIYPAQETTIEVTATIFARRDLPILDVAPLSSMFLLGKNDHRIADDFRNELHDSDGLLIHTGAGEWIWRPLSNPSEPALSTFIDKDIRGFGLLQRDRNFEHYQDLDLAYELRPSYWVEPRDNWGEGRIDLVELPTTDESNDNIVASWVPKEAIEAGRMVAYGYRITALMNDARLTPGGRAINTYRTHPRALGSAEPLAPGSTRFIIDFSGGDLGYFGADPALVEVVPSASNGRITRSFLTPNPHIRGFRAGIDVQIEPGQSCDLRAFLKSGNRALTETWTFPWRA